jgi:hypothetical protein
MSKFRIVCYALGVVALALTLSMNVSAAPLAQQCGAFGIVTYELAPVDGYAAWAAENGIDGGWYEMSGGIYNAFRYVFGQPTGDFAIITGIDIGESEVVITTPAVANGHGVTVSVVESSDLAGETVTDAKVLEAAGRAEFTKSDETPRFYRLKAVEAE